MLRSLVAPLAVLGPAAACAGAPAPGAPAPTGAAPPVGSSGAPSAPAAGTPGTPSGSAPATSAAAPAGAPVGPSLPFTHDDYGAARARARAAGRPLFVDAWAPWCHTCISMQEYVMREPALQPYSERLGFVGIDTDREENREFVERFAIHVWPTFFVLDPTTEAVLGYWPGSASLAELRRFLDDALEAFDASRSGRSPDPLLRKLLAAKAAQAKDRPVDAERLYRSLVDDAPADWPRRSEVLLRWMMALVGSQKHAECVRVGEKHLDEIHGASLPADFARYVSDCARHLGSAADRERALRRVERRLTALTGAPPVEMAADDVSDALAILADARAALGDAAGARAAHERRLAVMEEAAARAPSPQAAQTFDYGRANAYVALGRPDEAVRMLEERERQLPDSYEPPARLASVLSRTGRPREALVALERALKRAYGPRRLGYLELKASLQARLGDREGAMATLEEEIRGWEAQRGAAAARDLADARARLARVRAGREP
ncbi:MAG: thioredoxin family protein [Polyangiaceae bacterium]|nr:thioredoxin family protein [Polyangiaceae bacterium]